MQPIATTQLLDALHWRYATKTFDPAKKIPAETWTALEQTLVLTPSSFGIQPWKFQIITDPVLREKLVPASWGQSQPKDCSHFVVLTVKKGLGEPEIDRYLARTAEVRGTSVEALAPFKKVMMGSLGKAAAAGTLDTWQSHQIYIALGQFMAAAALLGVDTCPMEGLDPVQYDEILGLNGTGYATVVACAAGYRSTTDKYAAMPKVRFKSEDVIIHR
jgi:nitroreductase